MMPDDRNHWCRTGAVTTARSGARGEGTNLRFVKSFDFCGWTLSGGAALCAALPGIIAGLGGSAHAGVTLEGRKLPTRFSWVACQPNGRRWLGPGDAETAASARDI